MVSTTNDVADIVAEGVGVTAGTAGSDDPAANASDDTGAGSAKDLSQDGIREPRCGPNSASVASGCCAC
jgi:hypothetical protein